MLLHHNNREVILSEEEAIIALQLCLANINKKVAVPSYFPTISIILKEIVLVFSLKITFCNNLLIHV